MKKLVFVLLDGLHYDAAVENLGYLEHLVEYQQCARYQVKGELPSSSRPMYETLFTGLPVYQHGITNNGKNRLSNKTSVFDLIHSAGLQSLAVAYYWISELYVKTPFDKYHDIILNNPESKIQKGFFYYDDLFPDSHLYGIAQYEIEKNQPNFVFIHPMCIDELGHRYGSNSKEYYAAVVSNDKNLASLIPEWKKQGYQIVVCADHGMSERGIHGGNSDIQRNTALYIIGENVVNGECHKVLTTLQIAPLICQLLGIEKSKEMIDLEVLFDEK